MYSSHIWSICHSCGCVTCQLVYLQRRQSALPKLMRKMKVERTGKQKEMRAGREVKDCLSWQVAFDLWAKCALGDPILHIRLCCQAGPMGFWCRLLTPILALSDPCLLPAHVVVSSFYLLILQVAGEFTCLLDKVSSARQSMTFFNTL